MRVAPDVRIRRLFEVCPRSLFRGGAASYNNLFITIILHIHNVDVIFECL